MIVCAQTVLAYVDWVGGTIYKHDVQNYHCQKMEGALLFFGYMLKTRNTEGDVLLGSRYRCDLNYADVLLMSIIGEQNVNMS